MIKQSDELFSIKGLLGGTSIVEVCLMVYNQVLKKKVKDPKMTEAQAIYSLANEHIKNTRWKLLFSMDNIIRAGVLGIFILLVGNAVDSTVREYSLFMSIICMNTMLIRGYCYEKERIYGEYFHLFLVGKELFEALESGMKGVDSNDNTVWKSEI